jgi:thymidylate kinase
MKLIVIEGARGVGKSTYVQKLRNTIPSTMVMQLTGIEKTKDEYNDTCNHYYSLMDFLEEETDIPYTLVLDRFFFSECVMSKLYKDYDFTSSFDSLCFMLSKSNIDLTLVLLTLNDDTEGDTVFSNSKELFEERLQRPDKVEYQNLKYKAEASIKEQELYKEIVHKFKEDYKDCKNIKVLELSNNYSSDIDENIDKIIKAVK